MKVYVAVTEVTEAAIAAVVFVAALYETMVDVVPARLVASFVLVVTAEVIVPTVVIVTRGVYQ